MLPDRGDRKKVSTTQTQLRSPWRLPMQGVFLTLVLLYVALFAVHFVHAPERLTQVCGQPLCHVFALTPLEVQALERLGLTPGHYATGVMIYAAVLAPGWLLLPALIAWRRRDDWLALLVAFVLVQMGLGPLINSAHLPATWALAKDTLGFLGMAGFYLFLSLFPDGRFVPRWTGWVVAGFGVWVVLSQLLPGGAIAYLWFPFFAALLTAQVQRYRRFSTAIQRQQTKWILFSIGVFCAAIVTHTVVQVTINRADTPVTAGALLLNTVIPHLSLLLVPVSLAHALLRHRLWEIDKIINRSLVYSALSVVLGLTYLGSVTLLQSLLLGLTGRSSPLAVVLSTLVIAALFSPLRLRIQQIIDRRFYRQKYDAQRTLESFSQQMRDVVDVGPLEDALLRAVAGSLQPADLSLWLEGKEGRA
jgi:hypothetical protein